MREAAIADAASAEIAEDPLEAPGVYNSRRLLDCVAGAPTAEAELEDRGFVGTKS